MLQELIIQIFMAASLISGLVLIIFVKGYSDILRKNERRLAYTTGILLVYSVSVRFYYMMPGEQSIRPTLTFPVFDILYITIFILMIIIILQRNEDA